MSRQERAVKARGQVPVQGIRVRKDGFMYEYNDYLARNPACEVLSGQQLLDALADVERPAEPEPEPEEEDENEEEDGKSKRVKKKSGLLLADEDPHTTDHERLSADASRKLPK